MLRVNILETKNLRNLVLNMLILTLEEHQMSHHVLSEVLEQKNLSVQERHFVNRLFAGTLEKLVYLDYLLGQYSSVPVRKMKPVIRNILRLSVYQIRFMDHVPVPVSIDEGVQLTRKRGFQNLTGFVNAILRKISREADNLILPDHVQAFAPEWIWNLMLEQYKESAAKAFFAAVQQAPPPVIFRPNLRKGTKEEIFRKLYSEGCSVTELGISKACILDKFDRLTSLNAFQDGLIILQDISSMMAVEIAAEGLKENHLTVDVCAAPGGKSLFMAEKFPDARILSRDLTPQKTALIENNQRRLGITNLEPQIYDARIPDDSLIRSADAVLADLPCSGLGVIADKPDIKYRQTEESLSALPPIQRDILEACAGAVKVGGLLVYATCTILPGENGEQVRAFLEKHPEFEPDGDDRWLPEALRPKLEGGMLQILPNRDGLEGFFIARLRRKGI